LSEKPCGAYFFAFFENFFVPILTSGGLAAVSASAFAALYSAFGKYDVVHIHAEGPAFFSWLPKMFRKRVVVIAGGSSDTDSFMEELKELAKDDDRILFTGFVQGTMLDNSGSTAGKTAKVWRGARCCWRWAM
jgi:predicted esterase